MSYGAKSNDDLVMYYGFVEPDAQADVFEFGDMLAWLQERRAGVVNDDRVQTMYSKGLQDAVRCVFGSCVGVDVVEVNNHAFHALTYIHNHVKTP